jgi:hypothetical protein
MLQKIPSTVNRWIERYRDDFGFVPVRAEPPTDHLPGSESKKNEMRRRVLVGSPLFVPGDEGCKKFDRLCEVPCETVTTGDRKKGMETSPCGRHRYRFWERWKDSGAAYPTFICLAPGMTDPDKSIRIAKALCIEWGCDGFEVVSLFSLRVRKRSELIDTDSVGPATDRAIRLSVESASYVLVCWGDLGDYLDRSRRVLWSVESTLEHKRVHCFGLTKLRMDIGEGRMVGQPVDINSVGADSVTIPLPWEEVIHDDYTLRKGGDEETTSSSWDRSSD